MLKTVRLLPIGLLLLTLTACGPTAQEPQQAASQAGASDQQALLDAYETAAGIALAALEAGDYAVVAARAQEMVDLSLPLLDRFDEVHPQCAGYLGRARGVLPKLQEISVDQIEHDYHHDAALGAAPAASCYHAKDLLVHPATVLVLLREQPEDMAAAIHDEIQEVVAHMTAVRGDLNLD